MRYIKTIAGGKEVSAYLPEIPDIPLTQELWNGLDKIGHGLIKTTTICQLKSQNLVYFLNQEEALQSSAIENINSTFLELLCEDIQKSFRTPSSKIKKYVEAHLEMSNRTIMGWPVCTRLFKEAHQILLDGELNKTPGEFRRSQNWIGGCSPSNAVYVPPPPQYIDELMSNLDKFINEVAAHPVFKAMIAHAIFEQIHPFLDGNGRIGRMLFQSCLIRYGYLSKPFLLISYVINKNKQLYYDVLLKTSRDNNWKEYIKYFSGILLQSIEVVEKILTQANAIIKREEEQFHFSGHTKTIHIEFCRSIILQPKTLSKMFDIMPSQISLILKKLESLGLVFNVTTKKRNRIFVHKALLELFQNL